MVHVPSPPHTAAADATLPSPVAPVSGLSILVVDDDREIRDLVEEFLSDLDHQVTAAASGLEAVEAVNARQLIFDLAIVDWQMAGITGRDVINHIRSDSPDTYIFVATGHNATEVSDAYAGPVVDHILRKPFSLRSLAKDVQRIAAKKARSEDRDD